MSNKKMIYGKIAQGLASFIVIIILLTSILASSMLYQATITPYVIKENSFDKKPSSFSIQQVNDINDLSSLNDGWYHIKNGYVHYLEYFDSYAPLYIKVKNSKDGLLLVEEDGTVSLDETFENKKSNENEVTGKVSGLEKVTGFAGKNLPRANIKPQDIQTIQKTLQQLRAAKTPQGELKYKYVPTVAEVLAIGSAESGFTRAANVQIQAPEAPKKPKPTLIRDLRNADPKTLELSALESKRISDAYNIPESAIRVEVRNGEERKKLSVSVGEMQLNEHDYKTNPRAMADRDENIRVGTIHYTEGYNQCQGNFNCAGAVYNEGPAKLNRYITNGLFDNYLVRAEEYWIRFAPDPLKTHTQALLSNANLYLNDYQSEDRNTLSANLRRVLASALKPQAAEAARFPQLADGQTVYFNGVPYTYQQQLGQKLIFYRSDKPEEGLRISVNDKRLSTLSTAPPTFQYPETFANSPYARLGEQYIVGEDGKIKNREGVVVAQFAGNEWGKYKVNEQSIAGQTIVVKFADERTRIGAAEIIKYEITTPSKPVEEAAPKTKKTELAPAAPASEFWWQVEGIWFYGTDMAYSAFLQTQAYARSLLEVTTSISAPNLNPDDLIFDSRLKKNGGIQQIPFSQWTIQIRPGIIQQGNKYYIEAKDGKWEAESNGEGGFTYRTSNKRFLVDESDNHYEIDEEGGIIQALDAASQRALIEASRKALKEAQDKAATEQENEKKPTRKFHEGYYLIDEKDSPVNVFELGKPFIFDPDKAEDLGGGLYRIRTPDGRPVLYDSQGSAGATVYLEDPETPNQLNQYRLMTLGYLHSGNPSASAEIESFHKSIQDGWGRAKRAESPRSDIQIDLGAAASEAEKQAFEAAKKKADTDAKMQALLTAKELFEAESDEVSQRALIEASRKALKEAQDKAATEAERQALRDVEIEFNKQIDLGAAASEAEKQAFEAAKKKADTDAKMQALLLAEALFEAEFIEAQRKAGAESQQFETNPEAIQRLKEQIKEYTEGYESSKDKNIKERLKGLIIATKIELPAEPSPLGNIVGLSHKERSQEEYDRLLAKALTDLGKLKIEDGTFYFTKDELGNIKLYKDRTGFAGTVVSFFAGDERIDDKNSQREILIAYVTQLEAEGKAVPKVGKAGPSAPTITETILPEGTRRIETSEADEKIIDNKPIEKLDIQLPSKSYFLYSDSDRQLYFVTKDGTAIPVIAMEIGDNKVMLTARGADIYEVIDRNQVPEGVKVEAFQAETTKPQDLFTEPRGSGAEEVYGPRTTAPYIPAPQGQPSPPSLVPEYEALGHKLGVELKSGMTPEENEIAIYQKAISLGDIKVGDTTYYFKGESYENMQLYEKTIPLFRTPWIDNKLPKSIILLEGFPDEAFKKPVATQSPAPAPAPAEKKPDVSMETPAVEERKREIEQLRAQIPTLEGTEKTVAQEELRRKLLSLPPTEQQKSYAAALGIDITRIAGPDGNPIKVDELIRWDVNTQIARVFQQKYGTIYPKLTDSTQTIEWRTDPETRVQTPYYVGTNDVVPLDVVDSLLNEGRQVTEPKRAPSAPIQRQEDQQEGVQAAQTQAEIITVSNEGGATRGCGEGRGIVRCPGSSGSTSGGRESLQIATVNDYYNKVPPRSSLYESPSKAKFYVVGDKVYSARNNQLQEGYRFDVLTRSIVLTIEGKTSTISLTEKIMTPSHQITLGQNDFIVERNSAYGIETIIINNRDKIIIDHNEGYTYVFKSDEQNPAWRTYHSLAKNGIDANLAQDPKRASVKAAQEEAELLVEMLMQEGKVKQPTRDIRNEVQGGELRVEAGEVQIVQVAETTTGGTRAEPTTAANNVLNDFTGRLESSVGQAIQQRLQDKLVFARIDANGNLNGINKDGQLISIQGDGTIYSVSTSLETDKKSWGRMDAQGLIKSVPQEELPQHLQDLDPDTFYQNVQRQISEVQLVAVQNQQKPQLVDLTKLTQPTVSSPSSQPNEFVQKLSENKFEKLTMKQGEGGLTLSLIEATNAEGTVKQGAIAKDFFIPSSAVTPDVKLQEARPDSTNPNKLIVPTQNGRITLDKTTCTNANQCTFTRENNDGTSSKQSYDGAKTTVENSRTAFFVDGKEVTPIEAEQLKESGKTPLKLSIATFSEEREAERGKPKYVTTLSYDQELGKEGTLLMAGHGFTVEQDTGTKVAYVYKDQIYNANGELIEEQKVVMKSKSGSVAVLFTDTAQPECFKSNIRTGCDQMQLAVSKANTELGRDRSQIFFANVERIFTEFQGLGYYSTLFFSEDSLVKWRDNVDKTFATLYLGTEYWSSAICQCGLTNFEVSKDFRCVDLEASDGIAYAETPQGLAQVAAHIEGARTEPIVDENGKQLFVYKITFRVRNGDYEKDPRAPPKMNINVILKGDKTVNLFRREQEVKRGSSLGRMGSSAIVKESGAFYSQVCLHFDNVPSRWKIDGNEICNIIKSLGGPDSIGGRSREKESQIVEGTGEFNEI